MVQLYKDSHRHAPIHKVEQRSHLPGELLALHVKPEQVEAVQQFMQKERPGAKLLADVLHGRHHILLFEQPAPDPQLIGLLNRQFGGELQQVNPKHDAPKEESGIDMMKVRGYLGLFGQILQNTAARKERNPEMLFSSGVSLASNVVTVVYGVQQRTNVKQTRAVRDRTDDVLSQHVQHYNPPNDSDLETERVRGTTVQEMDRFMHNNATIISDGMKFPNQLIWAVRAQNPLDKLLATTQASAKVVTFAGLDKDNTTPDSEKSWLTRMREQSNPISGAMEFAAQFVNLFQSLYVPQIHNTSFQTLHDTVYTQQKGIKAVKKHYRPAQELLTWNNWKGFNPAELRIISPMRFAAAMLFLSGFVAKMVAPFSETSVDWNDVHAHAALALRQIPEGKKTQTLAELSIAYLESVPANGMTFGEVYQSLQQGIERFEDPTIAPRNPEGQHSAKITADRTQAQTTQIS